VSAHGASRGPFSDVFEVVLFQPEIPPNAGNVIRLCANAGARLHLIEPLGFSMDDRQLKRAGLDYHEMATVTVHRDWPSCLAALGERRLFAFSTRGRARYTGVDYREGDAFVFGAETSGLPPEVLEGFPEARRLRLPMKPGNRSLNLSNAVAIVVFEAWRQQDFAGGA
jgi:tRNA (cytidine/uridine-2'-O-)-methyltransferase